LLKSQFIESASSFHYIAGIGTHAVADITLTPRPPQASIFENAYFIAASWGIAFFVPTVLLLYRRTALFFRRFSVFFTALLIAFSWLFARPNLLGWLILLILFLTILRIQWNKMRLVVTNLTVGGMRNDE